MKQNLLYGKLKSLKYSDKKLKNISSLKEYRPHELIPFFHIDLEIYDEQVISSIHISNKITSLPRINGFPCISSWQITSLRCNYLYGQMTWSYLYVYPHLINSQCYGHGKTSKYHKYWKVKEITFSSWRIAITFKVLWGSIAGVGCRYSILSAFFIQLQANT